MDLHHIEQELETISRMIWQPNLSLELVRVHELPPEVMNISTYASSVHILGGWCGSISIEITPQMAESVTRRVLEIPENMPVGDEWKGVLKEFANVTGGNIKGLLGENCILSTPSAVFSKDFSFSIPETPELVKLFFCCDQYYFIVRLHQGSLELSDL